MELKDFVSETIRQIVAGTVAAQVHAEEHGASVSPADMRYKGTTGGDQLLWNQQDGTPIQKVDFDVAVTTTEGTQTKGGIGIFVGPVGLGTQGQSDATNQSVSRIRFWVPLQLPKHGESTPFSPVRVTNF